MDERIMTSLQEIRMKKLYLAWKPIQKQREELDKTRQKLKQYKTMVRKLAQKESQIRREFEANITEFNKLMP